MTQHVSLFLEDEEADEVDQVLKQVAAGEQELPPVVLQILKNIQMWKEPA